MEYEKNQEEQVFLKDCSLQSSLPNIWLLFNGHWFEATPQDYILDTYECFVCLSRGEDYWLLGNAFLKDYYSLHNVETLQFGMTPNAGGIKSLIQAGTQPT